MKAFLFVIAIGAGIGFLLPSSDEPQRADAAVTGPARETVLERSPGGHFYVDGEVNGELVHFLVDTGASSVALTVDDAKRLGIPFSPSEFTVVGNGASGAVRGKIVTLDNVSVDGKEARKIPAAILEGLDISLLGQAYLTRLSSVEMSKDKMILQ